MQLQHVGLREHGNKKQAGECAASTKRKRQQHFRNFLALSRRNLTVEEQARCIAQFGEENPGFTEALLKDKRIEKVEVKKLRAIYTKWSDDPVRKKRECVLGVTSGKSRNQKRFDRRMYGHVKPWGVDKDGAAKLLRAREEKVDGKYPRIQPMKYSEETEVRKNIIAENNALAPLKTTILDQDTPEYRKAVRSSYHAAQQTLLLLLTSTCTGGHAPWHIRDLKKTHFGPKETIMNDYITPEELNKFSLLDPDKARFAKFDIMLNITGTSVFYRCV